MPPVEHRFLDIVIAQRKGGVEPDTVANNFDGKAMVLVADAHGLALTGVGKGYHKS